MHAQNDGRDVVLGFEGDLGAVLTPAFALSGITSQNAMQIGPLSESKWQMHRTLVRYKINQ